ncbi:MAG: hypothetical protein PSV17_04175 [Methylotenera sp.]|uniref:hypothetical protein n=1 Tax=Methylotenera sp. TaxID=2051956 RepID=UPI00248805F1|nr:hypothetical protein [Methylotenera sp.]MDI1308616.1 hypothetical protein [Methylotenera sp.]
MNIQSNLYQSTNNFFIIGDYLVPMHFLKRLHAEVSKYFIDNEAVSLINEYCTEEFWDSLTLEESQVVGPCFLMLIENHLLRIN